MPQLRHEVASCGDCTKWPGTFNPSRANVIDRDAFNLGGTVAATNTDSVIRNDRQRMVVI